SHAPPHEPTPARRSAAPDKQSASSSTPPTCGRSTPEIAHPLGSSSGYLIPPCTLGDSSLNTPMRIASLQPSISITLAALGKLDTLCAITKYCLEALPELASRNLPILHDSWSFDIPGKPDKPANLETLL